MPPAVTLRDGRTIPQIGLGLWRVKDKAQFDVAFDAAVTAGYRHFDSAQAYGNEHMLGEAWQRNNLKREDIWITTKIRVETIAMGLAAGSIDKSLQRLRTDYVDLLLIHFPVPLYRRGVWKLIEQAQESGRARSIGVSNYTVRHLKDMKRYAKVLPAVNQVELHVFLQQPDLLSYCADNGIVVEAYSPLAHAKAMDEPVIRDIAQKYGKSYAQIMLRWCIQKGLVVLPKSVTPSRIQENIAVLDFELQDADMQKLAILDRNLRTCWSPVHVP